MFIKNTTKPYLFNFKYLSNLNYKKLKIINCINVYKLKNLYYYKF